MHMGLGAAKLKQGPGRVEACGAAFGAFPRSVAVGVQVGTEGVREAQPPEWCVY